MIIQPCPTPMSIDGDFYPRTPKNANIFVKKLNAICLIFLFGIFLSFSAFRLSILISVFIFLLFYFLFELKIIINSLPLSVILPPIFGYCLTTYCSSKKEIIIIIIKCSCYPFNPVAARSPKRSFIFLE